MAISYWQEQVYTNILSFGKQILPYYDTRDIELSDIMVHSMKLRCCLTLRTYATTPKRQVANSH